MASKKRLLLAAATLASVGAVVALATGVTFGLFSANSASQTNSFTAGKVTLTSDASALCSVTKMVPGDSSNDYSGNPVTDQTNSPVAQCELDYTYGGSVPADLGLDLKVATQTAGTGGSTYVPDAEAPFSSPTPAAGLFDGTGTGLQIQVTDGSGNDYITGGTKWTEANGTTTDNLASTPAYDLFIGQVVPNATGKILFNWVLPRNAGDGYELAGTTFRLQVHAVQAGNNSDAACVVGDQCNIDWS